MLEEAYGQLTMKEGRFTGGIHVFVMAVRVPVMIHAAGYQLPQMTNISSTCAQ
jgi:hypothetical protein